MAAAVLEQRGELADVVDRRIEAVAENRNAAAAVGLDRVQHRRVEDADRPVYLLDNHIPQVRSRSFATLEIRVHRCRQHERVRGVVAEHLVARPRIFRIREGRVELVRERALAEPLEHARPVLVGGEIVRLAPRRALADPRRHVERIGERDVLPAVVRRRHREVVRDLRVEDTVAVFLGEPQQRDRAAKRLRHRECGVAHVSAVREGTGARVAAVQIHDPIDDEAARADVLRGDLADETVDAGPRADAGSADHGLTGTSRWRSASNSRRTAASSATTPGV